MDDVDTKLLDRTFYELSELLESLDSLQDKYMRAKREQQEAMVLQPLLSEIDSLLTRIMRLTHSVY